MKATEARGPRWTEVLDVVAKLVGAAAVVGATIVANRYQSSMAATNLLVQREQADSNLRAAMFHDLIGPIVGSASGDQEIGVDRERLLSELLALNFHDHFELKPLMAHVDERLAKDDPHMSNDERAIARTSLHSAARRVLQRQIAMLTKADSDGSAPGVDARVDDLCLRDPKRRTTPSTFPCGAIDRYFDDLITIDSPGGAYTLAFTIETLPHTWLDENFLVSMRVNRKHPRNQRTDSNEADQVTDARVADKDFVLTWFDFPFSDNTLLADGTRFSLVIDKVVTMGAVASDLNRANFKLVWFPRDYFAAQERPTNYQQFREKLGLNIKQ